MAGETPIGSTNKIDEAIISERMNLETNGVGSIYFDFLDHFYGA